MVMKSLRESARFLEPAAKTDSGWRLFFKHFSLPWFVVTCWCIILFGCLIFWLIRKAWRRWRAKKITRSLGATTYPPSGLEFSSCPICLADFTEDEEVVVLPCGHVYKKTCLCKQLEAGYLLCGLCRAKLV